MSVTEIHPFRGLLSDPVLLGDMMAFNDMTQKGTPDLNDCKSRAGAITTECHGVS